MLDLINLLSSLLGGGSVEGFWVERDNSAVGIILMVKGFLTEEGFAKFPKDG